MLLRTIHAETLKLRRSPVWLAFLILPILSTVWAHSITSKISVFFRISGTACGLSKLYSAVTSLCPRSSESIAPICSGWSI